MGIYLKENIIEKDICTPMFITALFTIARTLKQPRCPQADEWIRRLYIHNVILLSYKKECICVSSNEVDEPRACYTEWSQIEKDKYCISTHIYAPTCKAAKETQRTDFWTQWEKERGRWLERIALKCIHYHMYSRWPLGVWCMTQGT